MRRFRKIPSCIDIGCGMKENCFSSLYEYREEQEPPANLLALVGHKNAFVAVHIITMLMIMATKVSLFFKMTRIFYITPRKVVSLHRKRKTGQVLRLVLFSSGERTRTSDLRVMSPTSYQLLYPAVLACKDNNYSLISKLS